MAAAGVDEKSRSGTDFGPDRCSLKRILSVEFGARLQKQSKRMFFIAYFMAGHKPATP
jgi:hypothetical protein